MAVQNHTAILGAGKGVAVYDVADDVEKTVRAHVENAWHTRTALGMTDRGTPEALTFHQTPSQSIERAAFVQESVPEWLLGEAGDACKKKECQDITHQFVKLEIER